MATTTNLAFRRKIKSTRSKNNLEHRRVARVTVWNATPIPCPKIHLLTVSFWRFGRKSVGRMTLGIHFFIKLRNIYEDHLEFFELCDRHPETTFRAKTNDWDVAAIHHDKVWVTVCEPLRRRSAELDWGKCWSLLWGRKFDCVSAVHWWNMSIKMVSGGWSWCSLKLLEVVVRLWKCVIVVLYEKNKNRPKHIHHYWRSYNVTATLSKVRLQ